MKTTRLAAFALIAGLTAYSLVSAAQTKKPPTKPSATAPGKKPPSGAGAMEPDKDAKDGGLAALESRAERPTPGARDAGGPSGVLENKQLDGGRSFRFEAVEVEGRLKSPQLVYFLRRVRAEFAAGDLGHRTFMRELSETRNEPGL